MRLYVSISVHGTIKFTLGLVTESERLINKIPTSNRLK